jgi:glycosyltransferase involved in cell wall biosynthesis
MTDYFQSLSMIEIAVLAAFSAAFSIQLFYYVFFFMRLILYKDKTTAKQVLPPLSVIICARNEAENLNKFLPLILTQDYPEYEVVVVNDGSVDETEDVLKLLKSNYPKLYVTTLPLSGKFRNGKKMALTLGLKAARNEWVVLTDADCEPVSQQWLKKISEKIDDKTDIILGYGGYIRKKGFLNRLIRFDTLFIALQYFSYAIAKSPYMGVGRNLAYRKSLFFDNKGFQKHLHLVSGDDDLFVNENANAKNTQLIVSKESFTLSLPEKNFKAWFYQKKRHLSTARYYRFRHKFIIGLELFSRLVFYAGLIAGMFFNKLLVIFLIVFFIRFILLSAIIKSASKKFNEKGLYYLSLLFDILIPIINFIVHISNFKIRKRKQ